LKKAPSELDIPGRKLFIKIWSVGDL
jgi:hypothetical protein